jgi:hypothetical protein
VFHEKAFMKKIATAILALLFAPAALFGQTQDATKSGASMLTAGSARAGGVAPIRGMHENRFSITPEQLTGVRLSQTSSQQPQTARKRGFFRTPMLVGALVGGLTGLAFGAASYDPEEAVHSRGQLAALGGGTLAATGVFMGWLVEH